jgi:hypothetical protein
VDELMEFVHARLDEEEQAARVATEGPWRLGEPLPYADPGGGFIIESDRDEVAGPGHSGGGVWKPLDAQYIVRHDPARTLRDVQARRKTLIRCQEEMLSGIPRLVWFGKQTVWEMAQRCSDHKEFREDWRP